jgi:hypothetical protein
MKALIRWAPLISCLIAGIISLAMAWKSLFSRRFIPFHEAAAGTPLENVDPRVRLVILSLMRTSGLGFLAVGLLLVIFPIAEFTRPEGLVSAGIPLLGAIYCFGLFLVNLRLKGKSGAETPWKGSLMAGVLLIAAMIITLLS